MKIIQINNNDYIFNEETLSLTQFKDKKQIKEFESHNNSNIKDYNTNLFRFSPYKLYLLVTNNCNLACKYCYAAERTQKLEKQIMPFSIAKKTVDFLFSQKKEHYEIVFFGGEPLMNFDLIKKVVEYCNKKNKKILYSIVTNGTLLNEEKILFIKENQFKIILSIDGGKEVQNSCRPFKGGKGTFEIIKNNLKLLEKLYYLNQISITINKNNLNVHDQIKELMDNGIIGNISLEIVTSKDLELALDEKDMLKLSEEYNKLTELIINTWNHKEKLIKISDFFGPINKINKSKEPILRQYRCTAFINHFAVSYEGNVYPCSRFEGEKKFLIGNINTGIDINKINELIKEINITNKEKCLKCWMRNVCGGGCYHVFYFYNNSLNNVYPKFCQHQELFFEQALRWYVLMNKSKLLKDDSISSK